VRKGKSWSAKAARRLRISYGLEPPPKRRQKKPKPGVCLPQGMGSIFDDAPADRKRDDDEDDD
jgi:hypothetical protein